MYIESKEMEKLYKRYEIMQTLNFKSRSGYINI